MGVNIEFLRDVYNSGIMCMCGVYVFMQCAPTSVQVHMHMCEPV